MFRASRTVAIMGAVAVVGATVAFVVLPAAASPSPSPAITSFTPTAATVGAEVTIEGTNLSGATAVDFNFDVAAPVSANSSTEITTAVPLGDDDGPITVTTPGGTATSSSVFTLQGFYVATTSLSPATPGHQYDAQLQAAGGIGPFRWTHVGALPRGITMTRGGLLTGVPNLTKAKPGSYPLIVHVRDSTKRHHLVATGTLSLTVTSGP